MKSSSLDSRPLRGPSDFHPELRSWGRRLPGKYPLSLSALRVYRPLVDISCKLQAKVEGVPAGVRWEDRRIARLGQSSPVRVRVYEPAYRTNEALPALLWIHAGGYVVGNVHMDHAYCGAIVDALGVVVVSVDYSLAPEFNRHHALEECHDALHWLAHGSHGLHVDKARIAVGGASAGGGLAASVVQRATDDGHVQPCFQMLVYPMLDDRTCLREPADERLYRLATREALVLGWSVALGHAPGLDSVRPYAVPARRSDLKGLPPTWMGFGTADIFHDENEAYAQSLRDARVPVETHVVPGAFHAFDYVARGASVTREFRRRQIHALGRALFGAKGATEEKARPQGLHDGRG